MATALRQFGDTTNNVALVPRQSLFVLKFRNVSLELAFGMGI
jgi:hypothetical protein